MDEESKTFNGLRTHWFKSQLTLQFPDSITLIRVLIHLTLKTFPTSLENLMSCKAASSCLREFFPLQYYFFYQANIYFLLRLSFRIYSFLLQSPRRKSHFFPQNRIPHLKAVLHPSAHWSGFSANHPKSPQFFF